MATPNVMIVSDLDHTMVQNEDKTAKRQLAFNHLWSSHCASNPGSLLVFSTGRSPTLFKALWQEAPLLTPDVLICSVGTEVFYNVKSPVARLLLGKEAGVDGGNISKDGSSCWACFAPDPKWESVLDEGWSRQRVQELVSSRCPQLQPQAASEQRPHKLSYILPASARSGTKGAVDEPVITALREALAAEGLAAKVIYSGGQDVDVLAQKAGKGCGLAFLLGRLREAGYPLQHVQVNGDSGNDAELLDVEGVVGCVVANAHPELRHYAEAKAQQGDTHVLQACNPCAGGIVEAMLHFGLLRRCSPLLTLYTSSGLLQLPSSSPGDVKSHPLDPHTAAPAGQPQHAQHAQHAHPTVMPADVAEPLPPPGASGLCGTSAVEGPPSELLPALENRPEVEEAARKVGSGWAPCAPGIGDACLQYPSSGLPEQLAGLGAPPAPPGAASDQVPAASAQVPEGAGQEGKICGLSKEEAVREWAWRLGGALAQQLAASNHSNLTASGAQVTQVEEAGQQLTKLPAHSPLRLFVTNSCKVVVGPPGQAGQAGQGQRSSVFVAEHAQFGAAADTQRAQRAAQTAADEAVSADGAPEVAAAETTGAVPATAAAAAAEKLAPGAADLEGETEVEPRQDGADDNDEDNLQAEGAADAAARDAHSLPGRTWVDQVQVQLRPTGSAPPLSTAEPAAAAGSSPSEGAAEGNDDQPLYTFNATFKVCCLQPDGQRSQQLVWSVSTEGMAPQEPVPHGYLATSIRVEGPLTPQQQHLDLPQCE